MSNSESVIKNEIFYLILKCYKIHLDKLFEDESACLLTFRVLSTEHQNIIMRVINLSNENKFSKEDFRKKIEWSDFLEIEKIDEKLKMFFTVIEQLKIFIILNNMTTINENFKKNLKKVITQGIIYNEKYLINSKFKTWDKCYSKGMLSLERYLLGIKDLDGYNEENRDKMNEKIRFLVDSGFLKKTPDSEGRLTPFALNFLLDDLQTQLRTLIIRFIRTFLHEANKLKEFEFLSNLFKLCTIKIGEVFNLSLLIILFFSLLIQIFSVRNL
jgi:hypothetical protein